MSALSASFMREQPVFDRQRPATGFHHEAAFPVRGDDTMTGNDNGNWISATGIAHGACAGLEFVRQLTIGKNSSRRDALQRTPHALLEIRAVCGERQTEFCSRLFQ